MKPHNISIQNTSMMKVGGEGPDVSGEQDQYQTVSNAILSLESLLADMDNFSFTKKDSEDKRDLEAEVDDLTEKLKTAMENGEEIPVSVGRCAGCKEEISDKSLLVGDKTYHEPCFVCAKCGVRLTGRYYQVNGGHYCEEDREASLARCQVCSQALTAQFLTINDQSYHTHCFVCTVCKEPIKGKFFKDQDTGKFLCLSDYQESREKCSSCGLPMLGRSLIFQDEKLHPDCFRCDKCATGLDGENFVLEADKALCQSCYQTHCAPQCARCSKAIMSSGLRETVEIITCNNQDYHVECYTCTSCNTNLQGEHVFLSGDHADTSLLVCQQCNDNAI